jgi:cardiolipin synthase
VTTASGTDSPASTRQVLTVPNALSVLRLLGVPLFLWLLLGPHADGWALLVLALSGFSDWADGVLARRLNQYSDLGALLDPLADRLYILASLVGLVLRHIIPLWLAVVIVGRDLVLGIAFLVLHRRRIAPPQVHYLLLYAFPLLLLGAHSGTLSGIARPIAWAFTIWGTGLYLWAGALYLLQTTRLMRAGVPV